jgi:hypothetical protein
MPANFMLTPQAREAQRLSIGIAVLPYAPSRGAARLT